MAHDDDAPPAPPPAPADVVLLAAPTDDGEGAQVIRLRDGRVEAGEVRPLKEGRPVTGEVVGLRPRPGAPRVCDVTVHAKVAAPASPPSGPAHKGPARVTTAAFRDGWDAVFGAPPDPKRLN